MESSEDIKAIIQEIITEIVTVFDGVPREDGVTLHEAREIDRCGSEKQLRKARTQDNETRWQDVPDADIENYPEVFCFVDPKGFRYYLPAYMIWVLKNYQSSHSNTVDWTTYALDYGTKNLLKNRDNPNFLLFTIDQSRAICRFLQFMAKYAGDYADSDFAEIALTYWKQFCE